MPNKKKQQIIDERQVTEYDAVEVLKHADIIIRGIANEEWLLSYDADNDVYGVLETTKKAIKPRRYKHRSLCEVLLAMTMYKRNLKAAFHESIAEENVTRISDRQIPKRATLEGRVSHRLREADYYFDLPDGTWKLTLSDLARKPNSTINLHYLVKVRHSDEEASIHYTSSTLTMTLLKFLLQNAEVVENPMKVKVLDFEMLKERKAKQGDVS